MRFRDSSTEPDSSMRRRRLTQEERQLIRAPKPGPSGIRKTGPPAAPMKNRAKDAKKNTKVISPIKYPEKPPVKTNEEVPLSKLTPRRIKPPVKLDLRTRLDAAPASSEPKIDSGRGPMESRVSCEFPPRQNDNEPRIPAWLPWKPAHTPKNNPWLPATTSHMKWGTAHRNRSFIEGKTTSRNDSTMTGQDQNDWGQENEEPRVNEDDVTKDEKEDEFNDPKKENEKRN